MPDILTHLICAKETITTLSDDIKAIIEANKNVYNLGAQGPDIFFYYKPQPWLNSEDISDIGHHIHTHEINRFFVHSANRIKHAISADPVGFFKSRIKTTSLHMEFSYLAGFLSHYAADTLCHPYIFYFSGVSGGYNHKYFECALDTLINDIYNGKKAKLHKTGKAIVLTKKESMVIAGYLSRVLRDTFNYTIDEKLLKRCFSDMSTTLKTLYDPIKIKSKPIQVIDKLSKSNGRIATAKFPAKIDPTIDYLNIKKITWCHPCDEDLIYHDSFLDRFKASIQRSQSLIKGLSFYLINTSTLHQFEQLLGDTMYDTGLVGSRPMIHENIIVDYKKTYKIK